MFEMFDEIFEMALAKYNMAWYDLVDSDEFDEVARQVSEKLGCNCWDNKEFCEWYNEMGMEL